MESKPPTAITSQFQLRTCSQFYSERRATSEQNRALRPARPAAHSEAFQYGASPQILISPIVYFDLIDQERI